MNDKERIESRRLLQDRLLRGAAGHLLRTDMPELRYQESFDSPDSPLLAVVRTVAIHLGVAENLLRLPVGTDPTRQDVTLLRSIVRLAGMQIRAVYLTPGWHIQDNGPLVAFLAGSLKAVAVSPVSPDKYRLWLPDSDALIVDGNEITRLVEPVAYTLYAGFPTDKPLDIPGLLGFMAAKCWPADLRAVVLVSLIAAMIPLLTPIVTQTIFEDIIPIYDRLGLVMVVQLMIVAAFAGTGLAFARGISFLRIKSRSLLAVEAALWLRLLSLPPSFFRGYETGDLAQRMASLSQAFSLLNGSSVTILFNAVFSFFSILVMLYYSWQLTLAAVTLWLFYLSAAAVIGWQMTGTERRMMNATGETAGQVLQIFNGLTKFRMQGAEAQAFYLWARCFGKQWKWNRKFRRLSNVLELLNVVQPVLLSMLVFYLCIRWQFPDEAATQKPFIALPQFLAFYAALTGFNATMAGMVTMVSSILEIVPQVERIRPILQAMPEVSEDKAESGELRGRIEVNHVSFRYTSDSPLVLRDVSVNVQPGQFVGIVGASGSGKSTLLRLLLGFETPQKGAVYFDGQDLADLNVASVRTQLGVVLQNGQLMSGDILSNIVGSLPLTIDHAWEAAEMVGLADDIRAMPMGMYTLISEGASNISGGQRQRLLIARAVVHKPKIILFDEATSALDNKTQALVTESLSKMKITRIVVAHRLSTIRHADMIYVIEKGEVVEAGNYKSLMSTDGHFAALTRRQTL